ncbi:MAG: hypothetical protein ACLFSC_04590 [Wenzhouxiangella sp.]
MSGTLLRRARLPVALTLGAVFALAGCTQKTAEPWINEGQAERLAGKYERDQQTAEQLRDRMHSGQAQR